MRYLAAVLSCALLWACGSGGGTGEASSTSTGESSGPMTGTVSGTSTASTSTSGTTSTQSDDGGSTTTSGDSDATSTGTVPDTGETTSSTQVCEGSGIEVPHGWQGPALIRTAETAPTCEGDFDIDLVLAHGGLLAPPASGSCECGAPAGMGCSAVQTYRYDFHNVDDDDDAMQTARIPIAILLALELSSAACTSMVLHGAALPQRRAC